MLTWIFPHSPKTQASTRRPGHPLPLLTVTALLRRLAGASRPTLQAVASLRFPPLAPASSSSRFTTSALDQARAASKPKPKARSKKKDLTPFISPSGDEPEMSIIHWTIRTISVPGPDTDLSLYVAFDNERLLFGAGEGTQRAFIQKRLTMRGLQAVFLPDGGHRARTGLPGVIMTASDAGMKKLTVVGPPDTAHYLATLRASVQRDIFGVDPKPYPRFSTADSEIVYSSDKVTVHAIALRDPVPQPASTGSVLSNHVPRPAQLPEARLDQWTSTIVKDMFRGIQDPAERKAARPPQPYPGMRAPSVPMDRFPLPIPSDADVATDMVYILRTPEVRGKFDVVKAAALGVPGGPVRGKLTRGESIEVEDKNAPGGKRIVRPEDCLVGGGPGSILIVVSCAEHNVDRLLQSPVFGQYQQGPRGKAADFPVQAVVHRVTRQVWEDPRYQAWVAAYGPKTQHLLTEVRIPGPTFFNSAAWNALHLHRLDEEVFPVPYYKYEAPPPPVLPANATLAVPNNLVSMHPPKETELLETHVKDAQFPTDTEEIVLDTARSDGTEYAIAVDAARVEVAAKAAVHAETHELQPGDDIVVTTLGTGSAIPSKFRNVSSTHLDIPGTGGILLDCGEGSLGQLRRRFGPEGLQKVYEDLRLIFISHMHADHHLGLTSILADRFKSGVHSTLYILAPPQIGLQLQETATWQYGVPREALENVKFVSLTRMNKSAWVARTAEQAARQSAAAIGIAPLTQAVEQEAEFNEDVAAGKFKWPFKMIHRYYSPGNDKMAETIYTMIDDLGMKTMGAPSVPHRGLANGLVLEHTSGWKVVYSGDTKPSGDLVAAGQGATILIHEATHEDDTPEMAQAKGHSTFGQAIEVGKQMNAKYTILNHFSQRYPKIPKLLIAKEGEQGAIESSVAISFDFMSLRAADTWKIAHYTDAMTLLYGEEEEDDVLEGEGVVGQAVGAGKGAKGAGKGRGGERGERGGRGSQGQPFGLKRRSSEIADEPAAKKAAAASEDAE
ncbi:Ribonuclease Z 1 [Vanrija pseudolonga]|uniref:ribonuclease Z n=1 Tax=Vanrija pseudolonga TaxID=143232 RepID=A0AAF0YH14_9TREE|nr:Ribonuclease Z 1 [Vanrija pseudolonga]